MAKIRQRMSTVHRAVACIVPKIDCLLQMMAKLIAVTLLASLTLGLKGFIGCSA